MQTQKVPQSGGAGPDVPLLEINLMMSTKMRVMSTDTTTTTTITHSQKYFLRDSKVILLKYRSQNKKELSKMTRKRPQEQQIWLLSSS